MSQKSSHAEEWLSTKDAAEQIGVSPSMIYKMIREGSLPASRIGPKLIRIKLADINAIYRPANQGAAGDA